ncbi:YceK/YidQ family lipoprotein [Frederiksenia canicola]
MMIRKIGILLMVLFSTGCSTLMTMGEPEFYSGTKANVEVWDPCHGPGCLGLVIIRPLSIIDFPFSLVGDTLMLPVKGIQKLSTE